MSFALHYVLALAVVVVMLLGLQIAARAYARKRSISGTEGRVISILESAMLSQHASVHVVQTGERRYLIGASQNCVALLAELDLEVG
ncbi:MAG TPA: flagellar biosynthetic protein FliO [Candidatus Rubrimentiphilum sp.]|nr:flagellar biosynthetic protein FliO [Candidatus Rubrimentiphilum sp.]